MQHTVSLRYQINLRIVVTSVMVLILGGLITIWQVRLSVKTELDASLSLAAQLIQLNFPNTSQGRFDVDAWLSRFITLEQTRHLSIQLKQPSGQTLQFTAKPKTETESQPPDWFIKLISAQTPKIEQQLRHENGETLSLIIQANPIDEIGEAWKESRMFFGTLSLMMALTFLAVNLLFNRTLSSISVIVESLRAIEAGDYLSKLPVFNTQEYEKIARAINHLTDVLAETSKQNQALSRHSLQIQEDERQHLAKELHDELGQSLTAIKVMAASAKNVNADVPYITDTIADVSDHLISVVRLMMRNLHPLMLTELGLKASLEDLLNQWSKHQPAVSLTLICPESVDNLNHQTTIQLFRIIQECLSNIARHAHAKIVTITLQLSADNYLSLHVIDDGCGCQLSDTKNGFGLLGIRERIKSLGGELNIQTQPNQGLSISARIPLC